MRNVQKLICLVAAALLCNGSDVRVSAFAPNTAVIRPTANLPRVSTRCNSVAFTSPAHAQTKLLAMATEGLSSNTTSNRAKKLSASILFGTLICLTAWKWTAISSFVHYVKNEWLLTTLDSLNAAGTAGLLLYGVVFLIWEMTAGITTPVETAAGMAFGPVKGILASGTAKLLGCFFTFLLARYIVRDRLEEMTNKNEMLMLMKESVQETPLRVALLSRFSPLPELAKNAGMGVLPVPKRWFLASLVLHGLSFTCLWTFLGYETAQVLRGMPPSKTLKMLMTGATWIGFGAPVLIGMWIKSLKDKQTRRRKEAADLSTTDSPEVLQNDGSMSPPFNTTKVV